MKEIMQYMSSFYYFLIFMMKSMGALIPVLLGVALLTLLERKVLGYIQFRKGPNLVGPIGILQPFADGLKLFVKESLFPLSAVSLLFFLSPVLFFFMAILLWSVIQDLECIIKIKVSLLFVITFSSLSVFPLLIAGWSSNSKYSLLGAIRGVAQTISYEVSFGLILLPIVFLVGGWGLHLFLSAQKDIWLGLPCLPLLIMWFISSLAETNRSPFDLSEGESELVSGYNVEYSGAPFALFFIGEYANMILMKLLTVILFFGGGAPFESSFLGALCMSMKTVFFVGLFLWVRGSFPRVRYDQLMNIMWKGVLPLTLGLMLFYVVFSVFFFVLAPHY